MTIDIAVEENGALIVSRLHGDFSDKDLLDAQDHFERSVTWAEGTAELIDLTDANLAAVSPKLMPELA